MSRPGFSSFLLFAALATGGGCAPAPEEPASPQGANVLLVSIDTLRPDHLSCYGYARETSPTLDALARDGALFENHVSSTSWTLPAHAAMFTGLVDSAHGCTDVSGASLAPEITTLAERFRGRGYRTAGFYSGPYLDAVFGLDQGFERWVDCTSAGATGSERGGAEDRSWVSDQRAMRASHAGVTGPTVVERASAFLTESAGAPFFAFVHLWDVHFDFTPPAPYDTLFDPDYTGDVTGRDFFFDERISAQLPARDREHLEALYDGEIRWTDENLGRLLAELDALGLAADTLVVVTSDHGTEFFEHGGKAHRTTLFDEQVRIPLIVRFPSRVSPGLRVAHQTRMVDLAPTLLELAGLAGLPNAMGESLVPLLEGGAPTWDTTAWSELDSVGLRLRAVRSARQKVIEGGGVRVAYDLLRDPREQRPLAPTTAQLEALGRGARTAAAGRALTPRGPAGAAPPRAVADELDALGYTGGGRK